MLLHLCQIFLPSVNIQTTAKRFVNPALQKGYLENWPRCHEMVAVLGIPYPLLRRCFFFGTVSVRLAVWGISSAGRALDLHSRARSSTLLSSTILPSQVRIRNTKYPKSETASAEPCRSCALLRHAERSEASAIHCRSCGALLFWAPIARQERTFESQAVGKIQYGNSVAHYNNRVA